MVKSKGNRLISLLGKKYTMEIIKTASESPKRFSGFPESCGSDKMKFQRLRQLEDKGILVVTAERISGRHYPLYKLSEKGRKILKISEEIEKIR